MKTLIFIYIFIGLIVSIGYLIGILVLRNHLNPNLQNFFYKPAWTISDKDLTEKGVLIKRALILYEIVFLLFFMIFFWIF